MSLYNTLFGVNAAAPVLLAMLGIDKVDVPRFRDCYITEEGKIAIYTSTGGGNRYMYEHPDSSRRNYPHYYEAGKESKWPSGPWNSDLRKLPGFQYDEDDDYDSTYATFYFDVPEQFKHLLEKLPEGVDPAKRWQETIERIKTAHADDPVVKKMIAVMGPLMEKLEKGEGGVVQV